MADNGISLIAGNYTRRGGSVDPNAIYVAHDVYRNNIRNYSTLTLNAINNGRIQIEDTIAGGGLDDTTSVVPLIYETSDYAYDLAITGDGTGTVSLYNDVINANVSAENVTVDFANGEARDYEFVSMNAGENTKLNLDIDFTNDVSDTITTEKNSTGTLVINTINDLGFSPDPITIQIIKNKDKNSTLQLALGDNLKEIGEGLRFGQNVVNHNDIFMQVGGMELATTDTENDSLTILQDKLFDTLSLINSYETDEERTFQFADSSKYMLSEDLTATTAGTLNIKGASDNARSTLDANGHKLFNLQNKTVLNIGSTSIENAKDYVIKAGNKDAVVNLTNAEVKNTNASAENFADSGSAIMNSAVLSIVNSDFSGNLGGAINNNSILSVTGSSFTDNKALSGGAINNNGILSVTGSSFTDNKALSGGALNIGGQAPELDFSQGIGFLNEYNLSYNGESASYISSVFAENNSIFNGYNFVMSITDSVDSEEEFNGYNQIFQELITAGEAYGSISDMPVSNTPHIQGDEAKEILAGYLFSEFAGVTFTYNGEELGTFYIKGAADVYSFGLYNPNATGGSIEVEIADTLFSGNIAENTAGNALGGAVSIMGGSSFTIKDLKDQLLAELKDNPEYSDMFEGYDLSHDFATKEEALAALDELIASGEYTTDPGNTFSDEYVINMAEPVVTFVNSKFINNKAVAENGEAKGGAIYANTDFTVKADSGESVFSGNTANGESNAIYLDNKDKTLSLVSKNKGKILFDDKINGQAGYNVNITGDDTKSAVILNNNVDNAVVNSEKIALTLGKANVFENSDFTITSGALSFMNGAAEQQVMKSANITGAIDLALDVDLANEVMDTLPANVVVAPDASINVNNLQLISKTDKDSVKIAFAPEAYSDQVAFTGKNPVAYSPIYKYNIDYLKDEDDIGYFLFARGVGGKGSSGYNPAVLNAPVANLAAGQATINETFQYTFQHSDTFTRLPYNERMSKIKDSRFALSTEYNENLGGLAPEFSNKGSWVRPYVTFESMNLENGPDVDAVTYGTLIGFDSEFEDLKNGWTGVTTGYVGYNGSQLNYSGNDTTMNGGLLGITQTFYKGNFWTAITASAGASVGETTNMYGKEDFTTLLAGIGSKTGYNFEFQEGKFILQPVMFMNYTFVNTFDYTNSAGVHIDSEPLHTIQLNPSIRLISNLKNGWQPYASVGMVWNLLNQTDTRANGVVLPEMHIKPYVEYGIGVQKRWSDKFTGFLQAMLRNGGRNGIAITGGFRWSLGKAPGKETVSGPKVKKVLKSRNSKLAGN